MGLLSDVIPIKWNPANKQWYESKGYIFTKCKDEFEVKIEDLSKASHAPVKVKCDNEKCLNPYLKQMKWQDYSNNVKNDGKYYCKKCAKKLFGDEKQRKTKLKNGKSFEQWCVDNNRQDILARWDYELNKFKPDEVNCCTKERYWFKCNLNLHPSELKDIHNFTGKQIKQIDCKACNSFAQWGIDNICKEFLEKYWDYEKNNKLGIDSWKIERTSNKKVYIKCQVEDYHGSYDITCANFTVSGNRCGYCNKRGKVHKLDSLGHLYPKVIGLWSNINKKSPYEYTYYTLQTVYWKCENHKHKDYKRKVSDSYVCDFRCPECVRERDESFLQEKVGLYLEGFQYTILHERNCTIIPQNPKYKGSRGNMPFDNEIEELKLIIEVNGIQHYQVCKWHRQKAKRNKTTPEYELHMQKVRDRYKRIFAKQKGYLFSYVMFASLTNQYLCIVFLLLPC